MATDTRFKSADAQTGSAARQATKPESGEVSPGAAGHWSKLSANYSNSGDYAAALGARQQVVEVYRLLYAEKPGVFDGNLARELLGLSKDLAEDGRVEEALEASQESGKFYRNSIVINDHSKDLTSN
ncbi:hypothetical protein FRC11_015018 [Ceratobasidium sp. 423]|nr:hypothetical protein FRC11_015018 [Ceratobasidium sp. 423]